VYGADVVTVFSAFLAVHTYTPSMSGVTMEILRWPWEGFSWNLESLGRLALSNVHEYVIGGLRVAEQFSWISVPASIGFMWLTVIVAGSGSRRREGRGGE
jgi:hypothetical protein